MDVFNAFFKFCFVTNRHLGIKRFSLRSAFSFELTSFKVFAFHLALFIKPCCFL